MLPGLRLSHSGSCHSSCGTKRSPETDRAGGSSRRYLKRGQARDTRAQVLLRAKDSSLEFVHGTVSTCDLREVARGTMAGSSLVCRTLLWLDFRACSQLRCPLFSISQPSPVSLDQHAATNPKIELYHQVHAGSHQVQGMGSEAAEPHICHPRILKLLANWTGHEAPQLHPPSLGSWAPSDMRGPSKLI